MSQRDRSGSRSPEPGDPRAGRHSRQERVTDAGGPPPTESSWTSRPSRPPARRRLEGEGADVERYLDQRSREAGRPESPAGREPDVRDPGRRVDTGEIRIRPHQPTEVAAPPATRATSEIDSAEDSDRWQESVELQAEPRVQRRTSPVTSRRRPPPRSARRPVLTVPSIAMPRFVAEADLTRDRVGLVLLGVAVFSAALMAAIMSNLVGRVNPIIGIHVDAAGFTDRWADATSLWRIPLLVSMVTLINLTIAWFTASFDRFAARVLLGGTLLVHLVAWMAVTDFL